MDRGFQAGGRMGHVAVIVIVIVIVIAIAIVALVSGHRRVRAR
jgi:hypothetical protein